MTSTRTAAALAPSGPGLVRFLAKQMLDPQDVSQREVAIVAEQPFGERLPADQRAPVYLGDLAQLVRPRRRPQVPRQL